MALSFCRRSTFLTRHTFSSSLKRHGYIVLVPEIGEDLPGRNPLLQPDGLPQFNHITIENCMAAIGKQTLDFESDIKEIENKLIKEPTQDIFKDVIEPIEKLGSHLDMTWGLSKTLYLGNSTLMPTKNYLAIHERARRARAAKYNSAFIYKAMQNELQTNHKNLTDEQERVVKKFILEGKLNGLDLDVTKKTMLDDVLNKLVIQKGNFKSKNDISTKKFVHTIADQQVVRDFPEDLLKSMAIDPSKWIKGPWAITLQPHCIPFMEYCPDRDLRWNVWQALVSRGSGYREKELETSTQVEEIRLLRRDQAKLLGYKSYADMSMETKMAGNVENVRNMLQILLERAKPAQEQELENLYSFAVENGFTGARLELWDVPYWKRKHRLSLYEYNEQELREYFPLPKVLGGLFELCEHLFSIVIKQRSGISVWHKDVKFYDIFESHSSAPVAGFYLDPYARSYEKIRTQNNGWMVGIQNHSRIAGTIPLAALIFNFQAPNSEKQSLLTFKEVNLLFHKFGHALQHLLSRTNYSEVSGLSNVEWDAVEICGYVLSHWLYKKSTIDSITSHYQSEDKLPSHLFEGLVKIHQHMSGLDLCRELYLSALDLELHTTKDFWLDVVKRLWPQHRCFPLDKYDSHPCSFTQIFTEEWAAAYYSYVWARVIAADVYSSFHEVHGDEKQMLDVGRRFRDTFLASGGSCHPNQLFRKFRGRDPSPKALLSSLGLKKIKVEEKLLA